MQRPFPASDRFVGLALFLSGVGLIYTAWARMGVVPGASNMVAHLLYFFAGTVLIIASLLKAMGKEEGLVMKYLTYSFIALTIPLLALNIGLALLGR